MKIKTYSTFSILLATALILPSCNVKYDTVTFNAAGIMPAATTPVPRIEIDTNVTAGPMGGDVKSNKPYDIRAWYMDDTFTFASASRLEGGGGLSPGSCPVRLPLLGLPPLEGLLTAPVGIR